MQIAVVADVHLHDLYGGYGMLEERSGEVALRTLADTMASTRVFNESHAAFLAVLDDIVRRGIRDVVLLGDYSDDGQIGAVAAVRRVLSFYEDRHGLRFFTTFGNHDSYGPAPRHIAKQLTKRNGFDPKLVTSDDEACGSATVCPEMRGMSTAEAIEAMAAYGVTRPLNVVHWEAPHGDDNKRFDASYLVEPQEGLWILMLDANVFHQVGDVWQVRANAAWDHVLEERPRLLQWMEGTAERARRLGKVLLAFSHYPALPLALTGEGDEAQAACTPDWSKRMPSLETGRRIANAGIQWHFSGHMHVDARVERYGLTNIAVPSPVAYPGGYVVVTAEASGVDINTVYLKGATGFDIAFPAYNIQSTDADDERMRDVLSCPTYADFLRVHLQNLIETKHIPDDWSPEFLACLDEPISHVLRTSLAESSARWADVTFLPFRQMVEDYYLLRAGRRTALEEISAEKIAFYRDLATSPQSMAHSHVTARFLELFHAQTAMISDGKPTRHL